MKKHFWLLCLLLFIPSIAAASGSITLVTRWSTGQPVRLAQRSVTLNSENGLAYMEVEDIFQSLSQSQCEGLYRFSLPTGGFISGFWINTDEKEWVKGEVKEIAQARQIYKAITSRLTDPGLLEEKDGEVVIRVFPVPRQGRVGIRFRCYFPALGENGAYNFILPLGFAAAIKNQGFSQDNKTPVKFKFAATFSDTAGISDFVSSFDGVRISRREGRTDVSYSEEIANFADFSLSYSPAKAENPAIAMYKTPAGGKFSLIRIAGLKTVNPERSLKLAVIIDGSGSMGPRNRERALAICNSLAKNSGVEMQKFILNENGLNKVEDITSYRFYGSNDWNHLQQFADSSCDGAILITDAEGLRVKHLHHLWQSLARKPLRLMVVGQKKTARLQAMAESYGGSSFIGNDALTPESAAIDALRQISLNLRLFGEKGQLMPLFGGLADTAYYVLPFRPGKYKVKDSQGNSHLEFEISAAADFVEIAPWFVSMAARQQIKTLEAMEQSEAVIKKITELGIKYAQATDYTAFIAVPDAIAKDHADVMNPAYLAMFTAPNFRKAREQARGKACLANQRVLLGAIEMYLMDNVDAKNLQQDFETGRFNTEVLVREKYLKSSITPATSECDYRILGDISADGQVFCVVHGPISENGAVSVEEMIQNFCREKNLDPEDFDIPLHLYGQAESRLSVWQIMNRYEMLKLILAIML